MTVFGVAIPRRLWLSSVVMKKDYAMRILSTVIALLAAFQGFADDKSKELDKKIIGLLLEQAEVVVHCHKDASGLVGMDPQMKKRYGLKTDETGFGLPVKATVAGSKIEEQTVAFWLSRGAQNEPFFLGEGDYLVFLRHDAQKRWVLVSAFLGIQPFAKGLDVFVKEIHAKKN